MIKKLTNNYFFRLLFNIALCCFMFYILSLFDEISTLSFVFGEIYFMLICKND